MRTYVARDMLIHEYDEFEWREFMEKISVDEYLTASVAETKEAGMRYFNVLVKPADELLSSTEPNNPHMVDTWRWDAKLRAKEVVAKYGDVALHSTAILALLARSYGATIELTGGAHSTIYIPIRGMGTMQCLVPNAIVDDVFDGLPDDTKQRTQDIWDTDKILEAVYMMDRKGG